MDWICPSPAPNLYIEALTPNIKIFTDGALRWQLGLDEVMRVEPPWQDYYPSKRHQKPCFISLSTSLQKRSHMNTEKNSDHLQAKRRGLRMKPSYLYLDLGLPAYRTWKINILYLSHLTYGILFWKPNLTNIHQFSSKLLSLTSHY